jgi:tRNA pseudouridine55 synthase
MQGLLVLDKPQGITSHDVVARIRRATQIKQVGHAGTLDPMATGVLVVCVGKATRLNEYLLAENKRYEGVIQLGERTNTDDAEGVVIETKPVPEISQTILDSIREKFIGEILQVPPQFSAIKKDGQRAYKLAREGERVELSARRVQIFDLRLTIDACSPPTADSPLPSSRPSRLALRVHCGSGTYIRSLARDIGEALQCGGHLIALRRTQSGQFKIEDAVTLDRFESAAQNKAWASFLLPMDRGVAHLVEIVLDAKQSRRFLLGQSISVYDAEKVLTLSNQLVRVYDDKRLFVAIGQVDDGTLKPIKVFGAPE